MGFNAKNLSYDANEPAFLRKLKAQYGGANEVRQQRPATRAQKRLLVEGEDDEPTYVDEQSHNTISKDEYEALVRDADAEDRESGEGGGAEAPQSDPSKSTTRDAEIGAEPSGKDVDEHTTFGSTKKKRKVKVIGGDDEEQQEPVSQEKNANEAPTKKRKVKAIGGDDEEQEPTAREKKADEASKKGKPKKGKKINLSFDADDDGGQEIPNPRGGQGRPQYVSLSKSRFQKQREEEFPSLI